MKLRLAYIQELDTVYQHFYARKDIFPHIRKDYIARNIWAGNVVFDYGVLIVSTRYKKATHLGDILAAAGSTSLHQILNTNVRVLGMAGYILGEFLSGCENDCYLTVRQDNHKAIRFYRHNGFETVGHIDWKAGLIPGLVMKHNKVTQNA